MSFTAKSVILDIADNWGHLGWLGLRSVDFYSNGSKIANATPTADATTEANSYYIAENAFDTDLSKTGVADYVSWLATFNNITNQRLIVVFDSNTTFDEIRVNNYHWSGSATERGAKNVVIHCSTDTIINTTYNAPISNSTLIFDDIFNEHIASDIEDEQILSLISAPPPSDDVVAPTVSINKAINGILMGIKLSTQETFLSPNIIGPYTWRGIVDGRIENVYLQDGNGLSLQLISLDITLSGTKGITITAVPHVSAGQEWLAESVGPYEIIMGDVDLYRFDAVVWDLYQGANRKSLVIRATEVKLQRSPTARKVPSPVELLPNGSKTAATIPGAWDIMPGDDLSAGQSWRTAVDSANIHIKHGESQVVVYG